MGKLLLVLGLVVFFASCTTELTEDIFVEPETAQEAEQEQIDSIIATRATTVQKAVYHEVTDSWIAPQADPYTLENFQKAYDKLAATTRGFRRVWKIPHIVRMLN